MWYNITDEINLEGYVIEVQARRSFHHANTTSRYAACDGDRGADDRAGGLSDSQDQVVAGAWETGYGDGDFDST
jgi:hypothetical protein